MSDFSLAGARNWHNVFPRDLERFERIGEVLRSLGVTTVVNTDTDPTYPPRSIRVIFPDGEIDFYSRKPDDMIMACNEVHLVYDDFIERVRGKLITECQRGSIGEEYTSPNHYKTKSMECREVIKVMTEGLSGVDAYDMGNVIKYLYRHRDKNGTEDLAKAITYIGFLKGE